MAFTGHVGGKEFTNTLAIQYKEDQCGLTVVLDCDEDATDNPVISVAERIDPSIPCQYKVSFSSKKACPSFSTNAMWIFLEDYNWLWGIFFVVGGIFLCLLGRKAFVAAIFIITAFATAFLIMLAFYSLFLRDTTAQWVGWVVLCCAAIIGIIVGVLMTRLQRIGAALLAGWGGFMLGLLINETFLYKTQSEVLFWCLGIGVAVVCGLLTFVIYNHVIILTTSFMGAYLFWRGVSLYAGGFPNEFDLIEEVSSGASPHVNPWFYGYLVAIIFTCVGGAIVQYKQLAKMDEEEKHPYNKLR